MKKNNLNVIRSLLISVLAANILASSVNAVTNFSIQTNDDIGTFTGATYLQPFEYLDEVQAEAYSSIDNKAPSIYLGVDTVMYDYVTGAELESNADSDMSSYNTNHVYYIFETIEYLEDDNDHGYAIESGHQTWQYSDSWGRYTSDRYIPTQY